MDYLKVAAAGFALGMLVNLSWTVATIKHEVRHAQYQATEANARAKLILDSMHNVQVHVVEGCLEVCEVEVRYGG